MLVMKFGVGLLLLLSAVCSTGANRGYPHRTQQQAFNTNAQYHAAPSQQIPNKVNPGYNYQPPQVAASAQRPQVVRPTVPPPPPPTPAVQTTASQVIVAKPVGAASQAIPVQEKLVPAAATQDEEARSLQLGHHMAQIQTIDVACGKDRMTVRISFDQAFNGIVYAKGHYSDPACRFVAANSGQRMYQFDMSVGQCGVAFIDSGLTQGGQAYVEGLLVIILEQGVQEAWDAARRIRCLWEGNIDQTVTFPLSVNMLDSQTLTFSGDTASASLEIQTGRGPRAPAVQGLVRIGDLLTAVVNVVGDADFDLLVRNCVATDGTPNNRVVLSDSQGCATKPKLMGGWQKQRNAGSVLAFAYLSAFKFPDLMDLFLECTVSLCKGSCQECPKFEELHVHSPDGNEQPQIDVRVGAGTTPTARVKRQAFLNTSQPEESVQLRRVVHVISTDDIPELVAAPAPAVYGARSEDCFSFMTLMGSVCASILLVLTSAAVLSLFRRSPGHSDDMLKIYGGSIARA